jgi:ankyrin repeat protein
MDPRSTAPSASSLVFLYANIAKAIKDFSKRYEAAPTRSSISDKCSAIITALIDIQTLLSQPSALSSRVISQIQLAKALNIAQNGFSFTVFRLEEEVEKCVGNQTTKAESPRAWSVTHLCDEVLIKGLLHQIHRQLMDVKLLIVAAQRNSALEIRQLLQSDTFMVNFIDGKDHIDAPTSNAPSIYSQSLWEQLDIDSKSSTTASLYNFRSGKSESYRGLDGDAASVISKSQLAPSLPDKAKKVPRAQMGSMFFKLFKSNTELHRAAKKGDAKKIKKLLDLGVDVNYEGSSGCTALHLATDCGHEAVVRVLLENGADPSAKSSEGRTPLHSATRTGHTAVVQLLLERGVDVQAKDPSGSTPLHIAAYNGQESVVQILLEKHPVVEVRGPSGFTALHVAAFNGQSAVVRQLVEIGADLEARSDTGRTALQLAAEKGHEAVVRHLLQHGANIMAKDSIGRTALQGAVSNQHGVVAQLLLDRVVVPESPSRWPLQRGSGSGPTDGLSAVKPALQMSELAANESPTWSRQALDAPIYELPASPIRVELVELAAGDLDTKLRSPASRTQRMPLLSDQKRDWGT